MDDSAARQQWEFDPRYDLSRMTEDMLETLRKRFAHQLPRRS